MQRAIVGFRDHGDLRRVVAKPCVLLQVWRVLVHVVWWQNMPMGWEGQKMCSLGEGGKPFKQDCLASQHGEQNWTELGAAPSGPHS